MLTVWYLCSVPNLVQKSVIVTEIDTHMLHLMTSRELTSGFDFWSRGHLRVAVVHLPIWHLYPVQSYWHFFPKFKMAADAILYFQFMLIWPFRRVVFVFCTKFGSNICYSHWDRRTYASFDDVTRINFRFILLVTWSSPHGYVAFSHMIWCKISLSSPKLLTFFRNSRWRWYRTIG